jgi:hypothetical protein
MAGPLVSGSSIRLWPILLDAEVHLREGEARPPRLLPVEVYESVLTTRRSLQLIYGFEK